jgi:outer membrane protein assembly factor BamC
MMQGLVRIVAVGGIVAVLGGCALFGSGEETPATFRKIDYKKSEAANALAIPPDLSAVDRDDELMVPDIAPASTATYSDYARERNGAVPLAASHDPKVLSVPQNVQLHREGKLLWLVVDGEPDTHWAKIKKFFEDNGFTLAVDNPQIGVLETAWAENRADIPQDVIRRTIGKVFEALYSAATRDQYRVRVERGRQAGTSEIYLTHRGMQEVSQGDNFVWVPRPSEPELEAEMLKRLMLSLGIQEERAQTVAGQALQPAEQPKIARLGKDAGQAWIDITEDFPQAWRLTGVALDRTGFTVEDRNRSQGIYYVRSVASAVSGEKGLLDKLAFWRSAEKYQSRELRFSVATVGTASQVRVLDKDGNPIAAEYAEQLLNLLLDNLNK